MIVLAHLQSLATHADPTARYQSKWQLIRGLYERGYQAKQVRQLYRLIDWLLELPKELQERLRTDIHTFEEGRRMKFVTSIERLAKEEGLKEGKVLGAKKAKSQILKMALLALECKFGKAGVAHANELSLGKNPSRLEKLEVAIRKAGSIEELRTLLK